MDVWDVVAGLRSRSWSAWRGKRFRSTSAVVSFCFDEARGADVAALEEEGEEEEDAP